MRSAEKAGFASSVGLRQEPVRFYRLRRALNYEVQFMIGGRLETAFTFRLLPGEHCEYSVNSDTYLFRKRRLGIAPFYDRRYVEEHAEIFEEVRS